MKLSELRSEIQRKQEYIKQLEACPAFHEEDTRRIEEALVILRTREKVHSSLAMGSLFGFSDLNITLCNGTGRDMSGPYKCNFPIETPDAVEYRDGLTVDAVCIKCPNCGGNVVYYRLPLTTGE